MHPRAPTTAVYVSSPLPSISLLNRNQRNHDTQLCKTFPLQAQRRWFIRQNGQKIQMTIHFFHQLFLHFCQDWLADLTQSGWTKYKMCLNINTNFEMRFSHCIKHITITIMTDLFFFHRKGGSELDNLREVYKFSGQCAVWPKGVSLRCEKEFLAWLQGARPGGEGPAVRRLVPFTLALISKPRPSQLQIHCQFSADPHVPGIYSCKINQYWTSMILNSPSSTGSPLHLKVERSSGVHFGTCGELGGTVCNTQCLVWFHTNFRCWHTFVVYCKCIPLLMHPIQPSCYLSGNQCIKTS